MSPAISKGGRESHIHISDDVLELDLAVPKGLDILGGPGSNPEQLFATCDAAYRKVWRAHFMSDFAAIAKMRRPAKSRSLEIHTTRKPRKNAQRLN